MNRKYVIIIISIAAIFGIWTAKKIIQKTESTEKTAVAKSENNFYWTCPMHPQIHQDHEGECPICHMKLVKVTQSAAENNAEGNNQTTDKRSSVQPTTNQLDIIGIQKTQVEKMNLTAKIPISGRILSSTSVAFQIYEKDVKYIHAGLVFKGESSSSADDEISGTISSVDSIVDATSRTIRVLGAIHKGSKGLLAETSFSGDVIIEIKDRLAIPESAVLHTGSKDLVYIFSEGNKLTPKAVQLGIKTEGYYEVLGGLSLGDSISSGPNFLIDSEAKIRGAND